MANFITAITQCLMCHFARNANMIMGCAPEGAIGQSPLRGDYQSLQSSVLCMALSALRARIKFLFKYNDREPLPVFRWQKSFHDHYIRNERDFWGHLNYIAGNPDKHRLPGDWPYVFTHAKYCDWIDPA